MERDNVCYQHNTIGDTLRDTRTIGWRHCVLAWSWSLSDQQAPADVCYF